MEKQQLEFLASRGLTFRDTQLRSDSINLDERSVDCSIATENPSLVIDWDEWEIVREILLCGPDNVILPDSKQVPLLESHLRITTEYLKGSIRSLNVANAEVGGKAFISSIEEDMWTKIKERHLTDTSAGYRTFPQFTARIRPNETGIIAGRTFTNNYGDNFNLVIRSRWELKEGSAVAIGADANSKFRSMAIEKLNKRAECDHKETRMVSDCCGAEMSQGDIDEGTCPDCGKDCNPVEQCRSCGKETKRNSEPINKRNSTTKTKEPILMEEPVKKTPEELVKEDRARCTEIRKTAERFVGRVAKVQETAEDYCENGRTLGDFYEFIVKNNTTGERTVATPVTDLDMPDKDKRGYSIWNLVRSVVEGDPKLAALEIDASRQISKNLNQPTRSNNSFFIDYGHLKRDITIASGENMSGTAGNLVATQLMAGNFVDLLYNKLLFGKALNVMLLSGLVGYVDFPRKSAHSTAYWIGENEAATKSNIDFGKFTLTPHTVSAIVQYSRLAAKQTTPAMEGIVMMDILMQISQTIDAGVIQGSGNGNQPKGILVQDHVNTADISNFVFGTAIDLETVLEDLNVNTDNLPYIMTPLIRGQLKQRKIEAGQTAKIIDKNEMAGHGVFGSKNVPASTIMHGDPSEIILADWGVLEIQINRLNDDGSIKIIPFYDVDYGLKRPSSWVYGSNFS
jgi:HK97 family phage major capsid protein